MVVQKTLLRRAVTLEHGDFLVRETVQRCPVGCRTPQGALVTRRGDLLATRLPPRSTFGYDVLVHVGLERFLHHRQREEIRLALLEEHGIALSSGEVSHLAVLFLTKLEALHEHRAPVLREALAKDGGWPLHVDATGEDGRGTLLVAWASWRRWVLGSFKLPTEREDAILPRLKEVAARFGNPCAVVRDLGRAVTRAVKALVAAMPQPVPILACHLHFLADVGRDLLDPAHGALRERIRATRVRPALRALARGLGRDLGGEIDVGRDALRAWQGESTPRHRVPEGPAGLAVVRGLTQWVLDFPADELYRRFPFDRPCLDLYARCARMHRAVDAYLRSPPKDAAVRRPLERLGRVLDGLVADPAAAELACRLRSRAALFDELRAILRLRPPGSDAPPVLSPEQAAAQLHDIRADLESFVTALRERRPERGPAQDMREAIDVVLAHLARHGDNLWGHAIALPPGAGGGLRVVSRTNNELEGFFHTMKHGERRRSGRKVLTQDFERLPPQAALAANLERPDYVALLCGSLDRLAAAFAELDAQRRRAAPVLCEPVADAAVTDDADDTPLVSASLPTTDRRIVRSAAMKRRIESAARSRAPRLRRKTG